MQREYTAEELQVVVPAYQLTGNISDITEINGVTIAELESRMRPKQYSVAGFLGEDESLLEVLRMDNEYVSSLGLTHRDLAYPLFYTIGFWLRFYNTGEFLLNGIRYKLECNQFRGYQESPFSDGTKDSLDIRVTNVASGVAVLFPGLASEMIARYGFYEGKGTSYRVEPEDIVKVFSLK